MISSILFDSLPETALIDDIVYPINYGYRAIMAIEIEMFGENNDEQKLLNALNIFYLRNIPGNCQKAVDFLLWFHACGIKKKNGSGGRAKVGRGYCFKQDAPLIYAAFREQYGIDLRRTCSRDLHWWEFSAMMESLNDNVKMAKVMYWRTCDLKGLPKEQKQFVKKMRDIYALREAESTMDSRTRLAKRNADMKEYVRKRMDECKKE